MPLIAFRKKVCILETAAREVNFDLLIYIGEELSGGILLKMMFTCMVIEGFVMQSQLHNMEGLRL